MSIAYANERTLEELAAVIARLQFVAAELQKARKQEQRRRKQAPTDAARAACREKGGRAL